MNKEIELKELNRHSEEIDAIMGQTPSWVFQWGITGIAIVVIGFIAVTWFIHWPEVLTLHGKLMIYGSDRDWILQTNLPAEELRLLRTDMEAHITLDIKDENWGYYTAIFSPLPLHSNPSGRYPVKLIIKDYTTSEGNIENEYVSTKRHIDPWQIDATASIYLSNKRLLTRLFEKIRL